ncbi:MAG: S-methyl-5-thioribose-1-phosphate isomerase [Candidatus Firestonebacteria bacterium]
MLPSIQWKNNSVVMIDQRKLPFKEVYVRVKTFKEVAECIKKLVIRGAPAIGIASSLGFALAGLKSKAKNFNTFYKDLKIALKVLKKSRPTAVNLFWALDRMEKVLLLHKDKPVKSIKKILIKEALKIEKEDIKMNAKMANNGAKLFLEDDTILTICNTGALATGGIGTAFGIINTLHKNGKKIKVIVCETRPVLQGARLTAWELKKAKIPFKLITDNMAGYLMSKSLVSAVLVGADRIASNGDTANKIGTYTLAVLANFHKIPFYVAAPTSTIDLSLKSGMEIVVEERNPEEVTCVLNKRITPKGIKVYNPAFDITPNALIAGIITEKRVVYLPYKKNVICK